MTYIIVVNYKSCDDTIKCVNAIKKLRYENFKLLVIDNDSQDCSNQILGEFLDKQEFHPLKINIGYAGGNNYGINIALKNNADYVLILNPDVLIPEEALNEYIHIMQNNNNIGALNPVQLSSEDGPLDQRFRSRVLKGLDEDKAVAALGSDQLIEVDTLFGASILLSRSAILKVGGFDPLYFAYYEEEDLCRRMKFFNYNLCVTMKSPVIHTRSYQHKPPDKFRDYLRLKGQYLYALKDINRSNIDNLKRVYWNLCEDYRSIKSKKAGEIYLGNYFKMMAWTIINYPRILVSVEQDKRGFSHL